MKDKLGFDLLSEAKLKSVIKTELLAKKIFAFWSVGSTNEFAYSRASQGEIEGTLVIAEQQSKGRGRKSRPWDSPFNKGLWFSLVLRPGLPASRAGLVPFLAGVSVCEAVENFIGLKPGVKWPNDLLLNGRKFCGILSEVEFENSTIKFIILGIGINVNHKSYEFPAEFREQATSLRIESGLTIDRAQLLAEVIWQLEQNYTAMKQQGFEGIVNKWKKRCPQMGKEVSIVQDDKKYQGIFEELNDEGCLLLRTKDNELKKIVAGDITF
jgi:BirA family biotin operon repressor/biotin-[acetyl-CoA-carboxylase] ligase